MFGDIAASAPWRLRRNDEVQCVRKRKVLSILQKSEHIFGICPPRLASPRLTDFGLGAKPSEARQSSSERERSFAMREKSIDVRVLHIRWVQDKLFHLLPNCHTFAQHVAFEHQYGGIEAHVCAVNSASNLSGQTSRPSSHPSSAGARKRHMLLLDEKRAF